MPGKYEIGTCSKCSREKELVRLYGDTCLCDACAPFEIDLPIKDHETRRKVYNRVSTLRRILRLKKTSETEKHQNELDRLMEAAKNYDNEHGYFSSYNGPRIPKEQCVKGRIYKIHCRNLTFGVFDGDRGFIGIREKLGARYLFTEYYEDGGSFGTVMGHIDTGVDIPADIEARENLGTFDAKSGRDLVYDHEIRNYRFADTGKEAPRYPGVHQTVKPNPKLFAILEQFEKDHPWDTEDFRKGREK